MKKTMTALVAAALLSFGVAYADQARAAETTKPADKPVAEASKAAETTTATAPKAKSHHHKKHATATKPSDGSVAPAAATEAKPAAAPKAPAAPKR